MKSLVVAAVALVAAVTGAGALEAVNGKSLLLMAPLPEMGDLSFFAQTRACHGNIATTPFGPGRPTESDVRGTLDLNDFWVTVRYEEHKTQANPRPLVALNQVGYDFSANQYVVFGFDNGGGYATETSPGWKGDMIVFTGTLRVPGQKPGQTINYRDSFTKLSGNGVKHVGAFQNADGSWTAFDTETCE